MTERQFTEKQLAGLAVISSILIILCTTLLIISALA